MMQLIRNVLDLASKRLKEDIQLAIRHLGCLDLEMALLLLEKTLETFSEKLDYGHPILEQGIDDASSGDVDS